MWKRIWILFRARNKEYYRDKSALGWNFLFPFLVIIGFSFLFGGRQEALYKIGVLRTSAPGAAIPDQYRQFKATRFLEFVDFDSPQAALGALAHHRLDLVVRPDTGEYWVSRTSPKGYVAEKLLQAAGAPKAAFRRQAVATSEVPYLEWLFPGILGMNIMFSALFGVGYVVVRYRKNGVLKRLSVTPVKPHEFLSAQILSRMFVLLATTAIVFVGSVVLYGFKCRGSYGALLLVFALGGFSMISLGLLVAARSASEEFAGGVLNVISWPMMFLSEVWFSLEGARPWVQKLSLVFPLTHMIDAARRIMNDGAGVADIRYPILAMAAMSAFFLVAGSALFKWQRE